MKQIKLLTIFSLTLLGLIFSFCGDDDDNDDDDIVIQAPTITTMSPSDGATDVAVDTTLSVTFDKEMNTTSVIQAAELTGPQATITINFASADANQYTFTPASSLDYNTTYTWTIYDSAKSSGGKTIENIQSITFTTEQPSSVPSIVTMTPADSATNISLSPTLSVEFSEAMNSTSVQAAASLTNVGTSADVPIQFIDNTGNTFNFQPSASLDANTSYSWEIAATAESALGVTLTAGDSTEFQTGNPVEKIDPIQGSNSTQGIDCSGAYAMPSEFEGAEGLGGVGFTLSDLENFWAWGITNLPVFLNDWIGYNNGSSPSGIRINPELIPEAGHCYKQQLETASSSFTAADPQLSSVLSAQSAFTKRTSTYNSFQRKAYTPTTYDFSSSNPLVGAIWGLYEKANNFTGAPSVSAWDDTLKNSLLSATENYPTDMKSSIAVLVLAIGEAHDLVDDALGGTGNWQTLFNQLLGEDYEAHRANYNLAPIDAIGSISSMAGDINLDHMMRAAARLAQATDACVNALQGISPFSSSGVDVLTPHGRIIISTEDSNDTYTDADLDDVVLLIDLAGNDQYQGQYASTHKYWMSANIVIDIAGDDLYNNSQADIELSGTTVTQAFNSANQYTQGAGILGIGMLIDAAGADDYRISNVGQGAGIFGVGVLADYAGNDYYRATYLAQGMGYVGVGTLLDLTGDDNYTLASSGQGVGRPGGQGTLFDLGGQDDYLAVYDDDPPQLPGDYNNYFNQGTGGYDDGNGDPHYLSIAQGVGWGFRGDWFNPNANWNGGFGALVDLGTEADTHYADCMSMGQGFVYGFGMIYNDGGNNTYRNFWWGLGSGTHMGVGLAVDGDGGSNFYSTKASNNLGHDTGVGWFVDHGGNDTYGGRIGLGSALDGGHCFFIDHGGDDTYAPIGSTYFGHVNFNPAIPGMKRVGLFFDLGGGSDTYTTTITEPANNTSWNRPPSGSNANPAEHKGIGLDK